MISGEFAYFQAVQTMGFRAAHLQMLREVRSWLEQYEPGSSAFSHANSAYDIHLSFKRLVACGLAGETTIAELDRTFVDVFGISGRALVEGAVPRSHRPAGRGASLPHLGIGPAKHEVLRAVRSAGD